MWPNVSPMGAGAAADETRQRCRLDAAAWYRDSALTQAVWRFSMRGLLLFEDEPILCTVAEFRELFEESGGVDQRI